MTRTGQNETELRPGSVFAAVFPPSTETVPLPRAAMMLLWTLAAGLAVVSVSGYAAPFSSNQNTYFLHGLAATGYGELSRDWLTSHADTFPLFTWLITAIYWLGRPVGDALAFGFYVLSCGVYGLAILLICRRLYPGFLAPQTLLPFLSLFAVFHSHALARMTDGLTSLPVMGVALFYPLGGIFQPQSFAVLLLLGIAAFLWNRPVWAAALVAAGCALHPAYLTCGGFVVLGMLIAHWRKGMPLSGIFLIGATALLIVLPAVLFIVATYTATDPEVTRSAHRILAEFRGPHHILLSRWLLHPVWGIAPGALIKFLLCIGAIILVRRTPLFWVLLSCAVGMWLLTLVYAVTGNHSLGVAYPWRGFALIVPLSTAIATVCALGRFTPAPGVPAPEGGNMAAAFRTLLRTGDRFPSLLLPLALCVLGAVLSLSDHGNRFGTTRDLHAFVRKNLSSSDLYLVPSSDLTMMSFRLETGAPLFVDFKSHPVTAEGFLEWYRRIRLAAPAFDGGHRLDCARLEAVLKAEPAITHVVSADRERPCAERGPAPARIFAGRHYSVWELKKPDAISHPPLSP